jgi:RNA recognition motif-containing protein
MQPKLAGLSLPMSFPSLPQATATGAPSAVAAAAAAAAAVASQAAANQANRIYIGSVHWDISEAEIRTVFQPFGEVRSCSLVPNPETGKHKGYG